MFVLFGVYICGILSLQGVVTPKFTERKKLIMANTKQTSKSVAGSALSQTRSSKKK
jgi:hypothetical protein